MIFEILHILTEQVNSYLDTEDMGRPVVLENIAVLDTLDDLDTDVSDGIALTLFNIEEESTLKNFPNQTISNDRVIYKNPKINLNLYILFAANRDSYSISLRNLSKIVEYFQGKRVFTQSNTVYNRDDIALSGISNFKFVIDLHTPSFEQINFIWGALGGRQLPSVMYRISLIEIERDLVKDGRGVITSTHGELNHLN